MKVNTWKSTSPNIPEMITFQGKAKHDTFVPSTYVLFGSWDSGLTQYNG